MAAWIAYDLALLCTDAKGRVHTNLFFFDYAVRTALLVDLALYGRLRVDRETDWFDGTHTGHPAADAMLEYIATHPDEPLSRAITSGPVTVAEIVRDPSAPPRRLRAPSVDVGAKLRTRARVDDILAASAPVAPADAALGALAAAVVASRVRRDDLIPQAGAARTLLGDAIDYLLEVRTQFAVAAELRGGPTG